MSVTAQNVGQLRPFPNPTILSLSLNQISGTFVTALSRGQVHFELKADVHIIVYMTQQTLGELISF